MIAGFPQLRRQSTWQITTTALTSTSPRGGRGEGTLALWARASAWGWNEEEGEGCCSQTPSSEACLKRRGVRPYHPYPKPQPLPHMRLWVIAHTPSRNAHL
mgnify:CR=1 FL=1